MDDDVVDEEAGAEALMSAARDAAAAAYCPYSGIAVGAALESADGRVFTGCNVENASYSLTICAERSAATAAVGAGAVRFTRIAIALGADSAPVDRLVPCGACLQFVAEFAAQDLEILIEGTGRYTLRELLGEPFTMR